MENEVTTEENQVDSNKMPELTIQDLAILRSIIDAASTSGTFKAQDMTLVGQVYDKLNIIVETFTAAQKPTDSQTEPEPES